MAEGTAATSSPRLLKSTRRILRSIKNRQQAILSAGAISGIWLFALCGLMRACDPIALTRPVTKIGLVAPFEGELRSVGYEGALYAVKLALREQNEQDGVAGWNVELVALDSSNHT